MPKRGAPVILTENAGINLGALPKSSHGSRVHRIQIPPGIKREKLCAHAARRRSLSPRPSSAVVDRRPRPPRSLAASRPCHWKKAGSAVARECERARRGSMMVAMMGNGHSIFDAPFMAPDGTVSRRRPFCHPDSREITKEQRRMP